MTIVRQFLVLRFTVIDKKKWINIQMTINAMDILFQPNTFIASRLISSFLHLIFQPVAFYTGPVDFLK